MALNISDTLFSESQKAILGTARSALHATFPDEFEFYSVALELVDSEDSTIQLLVFPILPEDLNETYPSPNNVKKTSAGVVSITNPTFIPKQIKMSGNFGRRFKFLVGSTNLLASGFGFGSFSGEEANSNEFSSSIKTGYGVTKVLDKMVRDFYHLDKFNQPKMMYFYNLAFNTQWVVEPENFSFSQNLQRTSMWNYNANFKVLAPLRELSKKNKFTSLVSIATSKVMTDGATELFNKTKSLTLRRADNVLNR
jgi:hypothetical protein